MRGGEDITLSANEKTYFLTRNRSKFLEATQVLKNYGITIEMLSVAKCEIQSEDLREIASASASHASRSLNLTLMTEDAGLFIGALNGFPGPYCSYAFRTIGSQGILKLMKDRAERAAVFRSVVAYCKRGETPMHFEGIAEGRIAERVRGEGGFGFDPVFIPRDGDGRSFAEMTMDEKNLYSHRARAFREFAKWYVSLQTTLK